MIKIKEKIKKKIIIFKAHFEIKNFECMTTFLMLIQMHSKQMFCNKLQHQNWTQTWSWAGAKLNPYWNNPNMIFFNIRTQNFYFIISLINKKLDYFI